MGRPATRTGDQTIIVSRDPFDAHDNATHSRYSFLRSPPSPTAGREVAVKRRSFLALADSQAIISVYEELDLDTHDAPHCPSPYIGRISPLHCAPLHR